ncbi:MAG: hypothetical protein LC114_11750 [Bryobacterales bacterium]|nr:hypothetical protein [Bryobacterales bacterium]
MHHSHYPKRDPRRLFSDLLECFLPFGERIPPDLQQVSLQRETVHPIDEAILAPSAQDHGIGIPSKVQEQFMRQ